MIESLINTVIQGDCLELMKSMPDKCVDLVLTDPPYGINYDKQQDMISKSGRISNGGKWIEYGDKWDDKISEEYFLEMKRISKNQIIFGGNYYGMKSNQCWIVWNKIQRNYMTDGEIAWTSFDKGIRIYDISRADAYINKTDGKFHPTQKPVQLFSRILLDFSRQGEVIIDPFSGSGTTAIACIETGRNYICIEKEKKYVSISEKRIMNTKEQGRLFPAHVV